MPEYRASQDLFIGSSRVREGQTFMSDKPPGKHWIPLEPIVHEGTRFDPEVDDDAIMVDGEIENIDGKFYASVDGLSFAVEPRNVRDDGTLTAAGIKKYLEAKGE